MKLGQKNIGNSTIYIQVLMMLIPWRNEEQDLKGVHLTYEEAYDARQAEIEAMANPFLVGKIAFERVRELKAEWAQQIEDEMRRGDNDNMPDDDDNEGEVVEDPAVVKKTKICGQALIDRIKQLNTLQGLSFDTVKNSVLRRESDKSEPPLRLFVSGEGGTGWYMCGKNVNL